MSEHIDDTTWEALAMGELDAGARREALAHVVDCDECSAIFKGLKELEAGAREFDEAAPGAAPGRRLGRRLMIAGTAVLAAAAALLVYTYVRGGDGASGSRVVRSGGDAGVVLRAGPPGQLAWEPVAGADAYRVRIYSEDGTLVWTSPEVTATSLERPEEPATGFWEVEALAGGRRVARSRPEPLAKKR